MKKILFLISALLITSCQNNDKEIQSLESEIFNLKAKIEEYENEIEDYKFEAFVIKNKDSLKLGEEYTACAGILVYNQKTKNKLTVCDYINGEMIPNNEPIDSSKNNRLIYRKTPKDTGTYYFSGEIDFSFFGKIYKRLFVAEYVVEN